MNPPETFALQLTQEGIDRLALSTAHDEIDGFMPGCSRSPRIRGLLSDLRAQAVASSAGDPFSHMPTLRRSGQEASC